MLELPELETTVPTNFVFKKLTIRYQNKYIMVLISPVYTRPLTRIPIRIKVTRVSTCKWGYRVIYCIVEFLVSCHNVGKKIVCIGEVRCHAVSKCYTNSYHRHTHSSQKELIVWITIQPFRCELYIHQRKCEPPSKPLWKHGLRRFIFYLNVVTYLSWLFQ